MDRRDSTDDETVIDETERGRAKALAEDIAGGFDIDARYLLICPELAASIRSHRIEVLESKLLAFLRDGIERLTGDDGH